MKPQTCQKEEDVFREPKDSTKADASTIFIKGEKRLAL